MLENISAVLYGHSIDVVNFSYFNSILPTVRVWVEGLFWILFAIYNYRQILYLIRGSSPIASGEGRKGGNK